MPDNRAESQTLDAVLAGIDATKPTPTADLAGRTVVVILEDGNRIDHVFDATRVTHTFHPADGSEPGTSNDPYEAFAIAHGLYYVWFRDHAHPNDSVSIVIDDHSGRTLTILTDIYPPEAGQTRVRQAFIPGYVGGVTPQGEAAAPTSALVGQRVLWTYAPHHVYEHVHMSSRWLAWQCFAGAEAGLADTDESSAYEVRPGIYAVGWRRKAAPFAAVTILDQRDQATIRCVGALFGVDASGEPAHATFGGIGQLLSTTSYPAGIGEALRA